MHCAKLFELVKVPKQAIFIHLSKPQYQEVRKVCIEAILHTDMVHHFSMVKDVQMLYEMNSMVLDLSRKIYLEENGTESMGVVDQSCGTSSTASGRQHTASFPTKEAL